VRKNISQTMPMSFEPKKDSWDLATRKKKMLGLEKGGKYY
jgi:hypothetical protein